MFFWSIQCTNFHKSNELVFKSFIKKVVVVYFDDILINSNNKEKQIQHLRRAFGALYENNLYVNLKNVTSWLTFDNLIIFGFVVVLKELK